MVTIDLPQDLHRRAQAAFAAVLANVKTDKLADPTPCTEWTVRELVSHVVAGNRRVGGEVADVPEEIDGLVAAHRASADAAADAFDAPGALERTFAVPFGAIPGSVFIQLRTTDVFTHAWDLAVATSQATDLDAELADTLLDASGRLLRPDLRGPGRPFAEEQHCAPDRGPADRLAALLGRRVPPRS